MKNKAVLLIILIIGINNAFAQIIDFDIAGVYLPVEYIESLESTKHNSVSWALNREKYVHTVYIVDAYTIQASGRYDLTENIYLWDIFNFEFENINEDIFLIDNKNNRYRKIPGDLYEYEYWSGIVSNFIGKIILDELIKSGDIIFENGFVAFPALGNEIFNIQWQAYDQTERRNLRLESVRDNRVLSLEIRSNEYIFYGYNHFSTNIVWSKKL
jgi:hypothetical protein